MAAAGDRTVLVVGGTGPTGPLIVSGLRDRGYVVTLFHGGRHEVARQEDLEHLHGDATDGDSLRSLLGERRFDLVLAMYGRTRVVADVLAGRCDWFVAIGGSPVYDGYLRTGQGAARLPLPVPEDAARVPDTPTTDLYAVHSIRRTEDAVFSHHHRGSFSATLLRYPTLYGPRVPHNWEWLVIRRVLDGRPRLLLADGGLTVHSRLATVNAAAGVLAVVDRPDCAGGQVYNLGDADQYTLADWCRRIGEVMGARIEIHGVPSDIPSPGWWMLPFGVPAVASHAVLDSGKIRRELGYRDAVPAGDAVVAAVEWAVRNADSVDPVMGRYLDYQEEDRFERVYLESMKDLRAAAGAFSDVPPLLEHDHPTSARKVR